MNLKHEMFWNKQGDIWLLGKHRMNLKHEMFWNTIKSWWKDQKNKMNLKHEMFWNLLASKAFAFSIKWTLNMKCFEMNTQD